MVGQRTATGLATLGVGMLLLLSSTSTAYADPPSQSGVLTDVVMSRTVFKPGDTVAVSWRFNPGYRDRIPSIELWFAHSTGMGHAPSTPVLTGIDPNSEHVVFTVPPVTASGHGNIWSLDLVWPTTQELTELSLTAITVEP
jgi:hypothetical protein